MAFGKKQQQREPMTAEQKIAQYMAVAESELRRSGKAGRLEAQTVHATRATAAATIAQVFIMQSGQRPTTAEVEESLAAEADE